MIVEFVMCFCFASSTELSEKKIMFIPVKES